MHGVCPKPLFSSVQATGAQLGTEQRGHFSGASYLIEVVSLQRMSCGLVGRRGWFRGSEGEVREMAMTFLVYFPLNYYQSRLFPVNIEVHQVLSPGSIYSSTEHREGITTPGDR